MRHNTGVKPRLHAKRLNMRGFQVYISAFLSVFLLTSIPIHIFNIVILHQPILHHPLILHISSVRLQIYTIMSSSSTPHTLYPTSPLYHSDLEFDYNMPIEVSFSPRIEPVTSPQKQHTGGYLTWMGKWIMSQYNFYIFNKLFTGIRGRYILFTIIYPSYKSYYHIGV